MNTYFKKIIVLTLPLLAGMTKSLHALTPAQDALETLILATDPSNTVKMSAQNACMSLPGLRTKDTGKNIDMSYILETEVQDTRPWIQQKQNLKDLATKTCKTIWEQAATNTAKYSPETLAALGQIREKLGITSLADKIRSALTLGENGCENIGKLGRTLGGLPSSMKDSVMKSCGWYFLGLNSKAKVDTDAPRHPKAYEAIRKSADKEDAVAARNHILKGNWNWQRWLVEKDYKIS
jgi:hypothetical protein